MRVWKVDSDFNPIEVWLEEVPACKRVIAVDWHQVSDVCRYSRNNSVHIAGNGQVPQDISSCYGKVQRRLQQGDCFIILSHIEYSKDNLQKLLRGVRTSRLPVHYVFVTEKRTGADRRAEVAQNLLWKLDLKDKACLSDDNLEVASEFCSKGGTIFHAKKLGLRGASPDHCNSHPDRCKSAWNAVKHISNFETFIRGR